MPCAANCVAARDLLGGGALLLDGGRDRGRDLVDLADDAADVLDGVDGFAGDLLDVGDLLGDFLGRLRGLARQRFDFEATTAKPRPASPARAASMVAFSASRLVWRGDGVDQADDFADPARRLGEPWTVPSVSRAWLTARLAMPAHAPPAG